MIKCLLNEQINISTNNICAFVRLFEHSYIPLNARLFLYVFI